MHRTQSAVSSYAVHAHHAGCAQKEPVCHRSTLSNAAVMHQGQKSGSSCAAITTFRGSCASAAKQLQLLLTLAVVKLPAPTS